MKASGKLVKLAADKLGWQKSTTHTVLRRLCDKGIFQNNEGTVTSLLTLDEFRALRSREFIDGDFCGSLPAFIAAFTKHNSLTKKQANQIKKLIKDAVEKMTNGASDFLREHEGA